MGLDWKAAWGNWKYHETQSRFWRDIARFCCLPCGRRTGKTQIAVKKLITRLPIRKPWPHPNYFYAAPTYRQARTVAWDMFNEFIPKPWVKSVNETRLEINLVTGASLRLLGLDKSYRHEGISFDGGIIDECSDVKPETFARTFRPALADRQGFCWFIGVPKRFGVGGAEYRKRYHTYLECTDGTCSAFTWTSATILPPEEVELARRELSDRDFREQFEASWETMTGGIFYAFDPARHVNAVNYNADYPLLVGCDFNVDPMAWVISQYVDGSLNVLDELFIRNTNTLDALNHLYSKIGADKHVIFMGDASGSSRKTSSTTSDWIIINNDQRFSKRIVVPRSNPLKQDRFACCNFALCSADDVSRVNINPRCVNLIRDLESRSYKPNSREPDDSGDIGHISDAFGYVVYGVIPMQLNKDTVLLNLDSVDYRVRPPQRPEHRNRMVGKI